MTGHDRRDDPTPRPTAVPADAPPSAGTGEQAARLREQLEEIGPEVLELCRGVRRIAVLSGAGISAESGVPTFRAPETGLWARYSPQELATPEAWEDDPELVWAWYMQRARYVARCAPSPGHRALASWARLAQLSLATQNIDDLHERAGSTEVAHLHGSLFSFRCADCGRPAEQWQVADLRLGEAPLRDPRPEAPPECLECDGRVRPDVVWFGEALPEGAFEQSESAMADAELVLVIGTSGLVQPAASLPMTALGLGTPVIEINPEPTGFSACADRSVRLPSGIALPLMLSAARRSASRVR